MAITNIVSNFKIMANDGIAEGGSEPWSKFNLLLWQLLLERQKHKFDGAVHLHSIVHY